MITKAISRGCGNCAHFVSERNAQLMNLRSSSGACRLNPPVTTFIPTPQGIAGHTSFPIVSADSWCGQHSPAAPSLPPGSAQ